MVGISIVTIQLLAALATARSTGVSRLRHRIMSNATIRNDSPSGRKKRVLVLGESHVAPEYAADFEWIWLGKAEDVRARDVPWLEEISLEFSPSFDVDEYRSRAAEILARCGELQRDYGPFVAVVAHTEQTLEIGADIRHMLGISGATPEVVRRVRNKLAMRDSASEDPDIRMPRYVGGVGLTKSSMPEELLARVAEGIVVKPTSQAGSNGVRMHFDEASLLDDIHDRQVSNESFIVEERIDGEVHHVDGLVINGRPLIMNVAVYQHDCLSWMAGGPMSSCEVGNVDLRRRLVQQAERVITALKMTATTFHMEFIVTPAGEPYFLEVGGRPGGAGIAECIVISQGVNLWSEAFKFDLGIQREIRLSESSDVYGWIVTPTGLDMEGCVRERHGIDLLPPGVCRSEIPPIGQVLKPHGVSGKFWLRGSSAKNVEIDIRRIAEVYSVECAPLRENAVGRLAAPAA